MFYSHSLLSRKGPLGTIWIAAYCFKKLKRGQIDATDISSTVDKIMPEIQISHRVLAQLLLGIVKIFSKKVDFLYVECNETLIKITRYFTPTQKIGKYTASHRSKRGIKGSKEVTFDVNHISTTTMNEDPDEQIETMRASYHQVTVTLPEQFELDSFDLGILDNGDIGKSHQLSTPQDEWKDDRSSFPTYLIECSENEVAGYSGYNPPCFTPLADILPSSMMDVDLELGEPHNSNNFASVQKSLGDFHCRENFVSRDNISGKVSIGVLDDELPEISVPLNHEQAMSSIEEPLNLRKRPNLQGGEPSGSEPTISNSFASVQKSLEDFRSKGDSENRENLSGNASLGILQDELLEIHIPLNHEQTMSSVEETVPINLRKRINLQGEEPSGSGKKHCFASPSDKQKANISEATASPKFMLPSPAINESPRVSRKRKKHYVGSNVLSNEVMRQNIHDASDLVCKRRKLPHTKLEIWKVLRFSIPSQSFTEPLIPFFFPELEKLPLKKSKDVLINPAIAKDGVHPRKSSDSKGKTEVLMQKPDGEPAAAPNDPTNAEETLENISKAFIFETSDNQFELMELGSHEDVADQKHDNGFSPSTRAAAQYLYNRLLRHRKQKQEKVLCLAQILEGRTRTECARFFYDTLALKTFGCINVKQDVSYGDVSISATLLLETFQRVPK